MYWKEGSVKVVIPAPSTQILQLCEEAVLQKKLCFSSIFCSTEAIHRSS